MGIELKDLKKRDKSLNGSKSSERVEVKNEIGSYYRDKSNFDCSIKYYKEAAKLATDYEHYYDGCFSVRALGEIFAETGDVLTALSYAEKFREMAKLSANASHEQLSSHVTAWIYEKLYVTGSQRAEFLETAIKYVEESLTYIRENYKKIDDDQLNVSIAGDSKKRKASLERLYSGIAANLGMKECAEKQWQSSYRYACSRRDEELKYNLLITKMDFYWVKDNVRTAEKIVQMSDAKRKGSAKVDLAHQYVLNYDFPQALDVLCECYYSNRKIMQKNDLNDYELLVERLILCFKYNELSKKLESKTSRQELLRIHESMGDLVTSYDNKSCSAVVLKRALFHFRKMLEYCDEEEDVIRATFSLALTEEDLSNYAHARNHYQDVLIRREDLNSHKEKILEVKLSILKCDIRTSAANGSTQIENELDSLQKELTTSAQKIEFYELAKEYYQHRDPEKYAVFVKLFTEVEEMDDDNRVEDVPDLIKMSKQDILDFCLEKVKYEQTEDALCKQREIVDSRGETRLHKEARNERSTVLDHLIKLGYDPNKEDNGGWTPLSEAVNAGCFVNVEKLLKANGNPNIASKQVLEDDDHTWGHGITPLMDSCLVGHLEIAELLLRNGASVVAKSSEGWTALEFLRAYAKKLDSSDAMELEKARNFETKLFDLKQKQTGVRCSSMKTRPQDTLLLKSLSENKSTVESRLYELEDSSSFHREESRCSVSPTGSIQEFYEERVSACEGRKRQRNSSGAISRERNFKKMKENLDRRTSGNSLPSSVERECVKSRRRPEIFPKAAIDALKNATEQKFSSFQQRRSFSNEKSPRSSPGSQAQFHQFAAPSLPKEIDDGINVKIKFSGAMEDTKNRMFRFLRNAMIGDVMKKVEEELGRKYIVTLFNDDFQLSEDVPLNQFGDNATFCCQLLLQPPCEMYRKLEADRLDEVELRLKKFEETNVLDLEGLCLSSDGWKTLLQIVDVSEKQNSTLIFSGCDVEPSYLALVSSVALKAKYIRANAAAFDDGVLPTFLKNDVVLDLESLEISSCQFKCSTKLTAFLKRCSALKKLSMAALRFGPLFRFSAIASTLSEFAGLTDLDLSYCVGLSSEDWSKLFSSCELLEDLRLVSCDLRGVEFDLSWLQVLQHLNVCGARVEWRSFSEWVGMNSVEKLNVSSTDIPTETLEDISNYRADRLAIVVTARRLRSTKNAGEKVMSIAQLFKNSKVSFLC